MPLGRGAGPGLDGAGPLFSQVCGWLICKWLIFCCLHSYHPQASYKNDRSAGGDFVRASFIGTYKTPSRRPLYTPRLYNETAFQPRFRVHFS